MLSKSRLLLTLLLASLTAGCTHIAEPRDKTATKAPKLSKERQVLSEGYSLLYQDARKFDASDAGAAREGRIGRDEEAGDLRSPRWAMR